MSLEPPGYFLTIKLSKDHFSFLLGKHSTAVFTFPVFILSNIMCLEILRYHSLNIY